ncbi:ferritin-like domain-containing protein [Lysobacter yangpyeongensis]|uniref:Ferritin-like domain-containing protein n=1 Tax=Lysobacter yangpyeongensis TaxID=346182 RepID=A0ABW0SQK6_9GAMM
MASSKKSGYDAAGVQELLYQALETEIGGIEIYTHALKNVQNDDLRREWEEYLEQTRRHRQILLEVFRSLGLDPEVRTAGREVVAHLGASLVEAIDKARSDADPAAAQIVAGECVVLAETKDHANWELIGQLVKHGQGDAIDVLRHAHEQVEDEEDHHLYHSTGWTRELWIEALGMQAVLPPPEEVRDVETKIGAARAEQSRDRMM